MFFMISSSKLCDRLDALGWRNCPRLISYILSLITIPSYRKPLPLEVTHRIDKLSPFFGETLQSMIYKRMELIIVLDAIDELSSMNFQVRISLSSFLLFFILVWFQARWSYLPSEIRWGSEFVNMVRLFSTRFFSDHRYLEIRKEASSSSQKWYQVVPYHVKLNFLPHSQIQSESLPIITKIPAPRWKGLWIQARSR